MKKRLLHVILIFGILCVATTGLAQEKGNPALKSEGWALALGLDPIPGDALFYGGKPIQGTINLVLGLPTGAGFWLGVVMLATAGSCQDEPEDCRTIGSMVTGISAALYLPMLIWDFVGGVKGVKDHNERVSRQSSLWRRMEPMVAVMDGGAFGGVKIAF